MRTLQRVGAGLLALTLAGAITACGDDDDADTTGTTAASASGDDAAFCDAVVEFNETVFQVDVNDDSTEAELKAIGDQLVPLFEPVVENAPDAMAADIETLNESLTDLQAGDGSSFNADATFETYTDLVSGAIDACDYPEVAVTGVDYAYEGVPDTIDAGTVAFRFTNASEAEHHMMAILRKKEGVSLTFAELLDLPENEGEDKTEFLGEADAGPGEKSSALASLTPGSYALVCFISVGSGEDGPPHFTQGMVKEFTVS